ncbi:DsbA family protein [Burkholderia anthina]|uniref:DsbA family protein n=1 Tax=Burkholderia anthina TaxID=179879 RepID=UPI000758C5FA|nr:DsbA family protein [Burkholderia anthina]KVN53130.1 thioredoxin [Burkholderia anthina]
MKLIYIGDPMCSWCYGFGKELSALTRRVPDLDLEIVVGGVRAGATDVLDDVGKRFRLGHWTRVQTLSGLPFNRAAFMAREGFVYDTEPVCRAVVTARHFLEGHRLLEAFRAFQHAFYADGLDTTDGRVLAEIATSALRNVGKVITIEEFLRMWSSNDLIAQTRHDFVRARALGATSFPTLLLEKDGQIHDVAIGYATVDVLERRLSLLETQLI